MYDWCERNTLDGTPEEREAFYESVWNEGGFRYWIAVYKDNSFNAEANKESCSFWDKRIRARIGDTVLRDQLAPKEMPHYFGIKQPCLEQSYFEQLIEKRCT